MHQSLCFFHWNESVGLTCNNLLTAANVCNWSDGKRNWGVKVGNIIIHILQSDISFNQSNSLEMFLNYVLKHTIFFFEIILSKFKDIYHKTWCVRESDVWNYKYVRQNEVIWLKKLKSVITVRTLISPWYINSR